MNQIDELLDKLTAADPSSSMSPEDIGELRETMSTLFAYIQTGEATASDDFDLGELDELLNLAGLSAKEPAAAASVTSEVLIHQLSGHINQAEGLVHRLQQLQPQRTGTIQQDPLCQLELQLVAASVNVEALSNPDAFNTTQTGWVKRLRSILLHKFNFINRLVEV